MERLQKVLAQAGIASRRQSEKLILEGRVRVNGQVVTELGRRVDKEKDRIEVDGRLIKFPEKRICIMLHKPAGYVTTLRDPQGRKKVTDLLSGIKERLFPIGRLDKDTEGLLLLTNDGDLCYWLTHPKFHVEKTYLAEVKGVPEPGKLELLRKGVKLEEGMTSPAGVRMVDQKTGNAVLEIVIHEGRKRQVKRMCAAIGHPVLKLKRVGFGGLWLGDLPRGTYRFLTEREIEKLYEMARFANR